MTRALLRSLAAALLVVATCGGSCSFGGSGHYRICTVHGDHPAGTCDPKKDGEGEDPPPPPVFVSRLWLRGPLASVPLPAGWILGAGPDGGAVAVAVPAPAPR